MNSVLQNFQEEGIGWFVPDTTLRVGNEFFDSSDKSDKNEEDDWYERCAKAWGLNILERKIRTTTQQTSATNYPPPYVLRTTSNAQANKNLDIISDTEGYLPLIGNKNHDTLPTFYRDIRMILIPKKAKRILQRLSERKLKEIDENKDVAVEKCLIILSNLSDTYYLKMYYSVNHRWKSLSSKILDDQTKKVHISIYKKIIRLLIDLDIIKVYKNDDGNEAYQAGVSSKQYRLTDEFYTSGYTQHIIKHEEIINSRRNIEKEQIKKAEKNIITNNIIEVRKHISIPTVKLALKEGKRLVKKKGGYSKKGKKLIYLNKKSRKNYNSEKYMFLEDHLKQYETLYKVLAFPKLGSAKSGNRVACFLNLIPSWIRRLIKIDGEKTVEVDIVTFHPNIAMSIYEGTGTHICHDIVAEYLNIERMEAKKEHLSFFNKHVSQMKKSPLFEYYMNMEPLMMKNLLKEKIEYDYKITSKRLLTKETEVMTSAIESLNNQNIYIGYIYDGLMCKKSDAEKVKQAIDKALKFHGINTYSKI